MTRWVLIGLCIVGGCVPAGVLAQSDMPSTLAIDGDRLYERHCAACHAPGPGHPGTQSLQIKYGATLPAVLTARTDLNAAAVAYFVRHGVGSMPPFRKTEISDTEMALIGRFLQKR